MSVSTPQMSTMKAVEAWVSIINSDMSGMVRTAFKATRPTFSGEGGPLREFSAGQTSLPLEFPEASLSISTGVDFSQGTIVASTSKLHMALNGQGFFPVVPGNSLTPVLYTRDGEFNLQPASNGGYCLVNPQGLRLYIPSQGDVATIPNSDEQLFNPYQLFSSTGGPYPMEIVTPTAPQIQLRFSAYGATTFEQAPPVTGFTSDPLDPANHPKFTNTNTALAQQSLEGSNTNMDTLIPELSLAQHLFSAIAKLLEAENQRWDNIVNTIK